MCERLEKSQATMVAHRITWGGDKLASQKGIDYHKGLLSSLLDGLNLTPKDAVVLIDMSPGLGDTCIRTRTIDSPL